MAQGLGTYVQKLVWNLYCYFGSVDFDVLDLLDVFGIPEQEARQGRGGGGGHKEGAALYSLKRIALYLRTSMHDRMNVSGRTWATASSD